jgi:hypothetical protein
VKGTYCSSTKQPALPGVSSSFENLSQLTRPDLVNIHYHMGILILCELLVSAERASLVPGLAQMHGESVREVLNIVKFATSSSVSFKEFPPTTSSTSAPIKLCLLSVDPYPHHVVASLQSAVDYLVTCTDGGSITNDKLQELGKRVIDALEMLPQCSQSLQAAKSEIVSKLESHQLRPSICSGLVSDPTNVPQTPC